MIDHTLEHSRLAPDQLRFKLGDRANDRSILIVKHGKRLHLYTRRHEGFSRVTSLTPDEASDLATRLQGAVNDKT